MHNNCNESERPSGPTKLRGPTGPGGPTGQGGKGENSLEIINKLRSVSFNWKDKLNTNKKIGFIAQEVEQLLPEVVTTSNAKPVIFPADIPAACISLALIKN